MFWATPSAIASGLRYSSLCALLSKEMQADVYDIIFASCERPQTSLYLCEFPQHSDLETKHTKRRPIDVQRLPTPCPAELSAGNGTVKDECQKIPFPFTVCEGNHITHTFLASVDERYCTSLKSKKSPNTGCISVVYRV